MFSLDFKKHKKRDLIWGILFIILAFFDDMTLLPIMWGVIKKISVRSKQFLCVFLSIAFFIILILLAKYFYNTIRKKKNLLWGNKKTHNNKKNGAIIFLAWLILMVLQELNGTLSNLLGSHGSTNGKELGKIFQSNHIYASGLLICTIILAPILEELLYRGVLMNLISNNFNILSLIISAVVFAIMHQGFTPLSFTFYTCCGFVFGGIYKYTKSLKVSMITHGLYNFTLDLPILITLMF